MIVFKGYFMPCAMVPYICTSYTVRQTIINIEHLVIYVFIVLLASQKTVLPFRKGKLHCTYNFSTHKIIFFFKSHLRFYP